MQMKYLMILLSSIIFPGLAKAQKAHFTHADTLRGSNGPGRLAYDVLHYDISVKPDLERKTIAGKNTVRMRINAFDSLQVDLQVPMQIDSIRVGEKSLSFRREGNVFWVQNPGKGIQLITFWFSGKPREAVSPPWDGGWIWRKDATGKPFVSVACQGLGASVWYPCKDYQGDEPDSGATLHITVPQGLMAVGNGRLTDSISSANEKTYTWKVVNPINNYNIIPYIGDYVHFGEIYNGEKGPLTMDYYVLRYNLEKAKKQFTDAPKTIKALEHWFGPYPFYEDGYKLVEAPHLGMEHQSAVAYGNGYMMGYRGRDLSGTGLGLKWDFIIEHETGHEWFGNNITTKDIADMWVHEGFTTYSEALFQEYFWGKQEGEAYCLGQRKGIQNRNIITGIYGVNAEGNGDMYNKGASMIQTIRILMKNDEKFRQMLREMNRKFYHQTVTSSDIERFISKYSGLNLQALFDQYLRTTAIPHLHWWRENNRVFYQLKNAVKGFRYVTEAAYGSQRFKLSLENKVKSIRVKDGEQFGLHIDPALYIEVINKKPDASATGSIMVKTKN